MEDDTQKEDTTPDIQEHETTTDATETDNELPEANFWDDFTDESLKENGSVRKFKSVEALAKSYVGLQKKLGERVSYVKPPPNATPEQMSAWRSFKRDGVEKEEDYGFTPPEELTDFNPGVIGKALFESGADKDMYKNVMNSLYSAESERRTAERVVREKGEAELRDEWNEDYEVNMKAVKMFVKNRFPDVYEGLEKTDAFRIPSVARMFKQLNELTADGEIRIQKASNESYEERLKAIESSDAFNNSWHPGYKEARKNWCNLISERASKQR